MAAVRANRGLDELDGWLAAGIDPGAVFIVDPQLADGGVLDLRSLGMEEPVSMRVRVGRNLTSFPLPGSMTKVDRIKFEKQMLGA